STWLTPPVMNSQMTLFARGLKWGLPSGGRQAASSSAFAIIAPIARPVKPMPVSARNVRRLTRPQPMGPPLSNHHEVVVIEQHLDQVLPRALRRVGRRRDPCGPAAGERRELSSGEERFLRLQESGALLALRLRG